MKLRSIISIVIYIFFTCTLSFGMDTAIGVLSQAPAYIERAYYAYQGLETLSHMAESYRHHEAASRIEPLHSTGITTLNCDFHTAKDMAEQMAGNLDFSRNHHLDSIVQNQIEAPSSTAISTDIYSSSHSYIDANQHTHNEITISCQQASNIIETTIADLTTMIPDPQIPLERNEPVSAFDIYEYRDSSADNRMHVGYEFTTEPISKPSSPLKENETLQEVHHITREQSDIHKLQKLLSFSDNAETISLQIAASFQELRIKLTPEVNVALRNFFFDKQGHFNRVTTPEQQEQLVHILAPGIKEFFMRHNNYQGYITFLKENTARGIPGFQLVLDRELGKAGWADYLYRAGDSVSSFVYARTHRSTKIFEIQQGPFFKHLSQIITYCKTNRFSEAEHYLDNALKTAVQQHRENLDELVKISEDLMGVQTVYTQMRQKAQQPTLEVEKNVLNTSPSHIEAANATQTSLHQQEKATTAAPTTSHTTIPLEHEVQPYAQADGTNESQKHLNHPIPSDFAEATSPNPNNNDLKPEKPQKDTVESEVRTSLTDTKTFTDAQKYIQKNTEEFKKLNLEPISNKNLKHIVNKHTREGIQGIQRNSSFFNDGENFVELALEGWKKGNPINTQIKVYDVGRSIGITEEGQPTSLIKIVLTESENSIKTIFPC